MAPYGADLNDMPIASSRLADGSTGADPSRDFGIAPRDHLDCFGDDVGEVDGSIGDGEWLIDRFMVTDSVAEVVEFFDSAVDFFTAVASGEMSKGCELGSYGRVPESVLVSGNKQEAPKPERTLSDEAVRFRARAGGPRVFDLAFCILDHAQGSAAEVDPSRIVVIPAQQRARPLTGVEVTDRCSDGIPQNNLDIGDNGPGCSSEFGIPFVQGDRRNRISLTLSRSCRLQVTGRSRHRDRSLELGEAQHRPQSKESGCPFTILQPIVVWVNLGMARLKAATRVLTFLANNRHAPERGIKSPTPCAAHPTCLAPFADLSSIEDLPPTLDPLATCVESCTSEVGGPYIPREVDGVEMLVGWPVVVGVCW